MEWLNQFTFDRAAGNQDEFKVLNKIQGEFTTKYIQKVTGYQINYERITRDTNPDVICTIFETINTTGVKLTVFDLLVAKCFKKNIRLRDNLETLMAANPALAAFDVEGIDIAESQLPRIISLRHNRQCKKGDILKLDPEIIGRGWDEATQALLKAIDIVMTRYGVPTAAFLPSQDVISPLAYIVSHSDFSMQKHGQQLDLWYWSLCFTQYLSGAPESKTARECRDWFGKPDAWAYNPDNVPESCAGFEVDAEELHEASRTSGLYKSVYTLLIAAGGHDLGVEQDGTRKLLKEKKASELEDHHIFPQRFLYNHGIKGSRANCILNRIPIGVSANRQIGSLGPSVYIKDTTVVGKPDREVFTGLGLNRALLEAEFSADNYQSFLNDRAQRIISLLRERVPVAARL